MTETLGLAPAEEVRVELVDRLPARTSWARSARVNQPSLGRDLEMRIFPSGFTEQQAALFFQELRNLSSLDDAGFVPVHDSLLYKGCPCYLVQLREDPTLDQLVNQGALDLKQRARVVRSLGDALAAAHARGILVGPIPPSRIAWNADTGRAYFLHLGASPEDWRHPLLEHSPLYGAREPLSEPNDVLAWGILAAWVLTGGQPVYGDPDGEASSLRLQVPELAAGLGMAVEASLARDPELRPGSGGALRAILASDPQDLAASRALPPEEIPLETISARVLDRLDQGDSRAPRPGAPRPGPRPGRRSADLEDAFRTPGAPGGTDLGKMTRMAKNMGLTLVPDAPIPWRPTPSGPWVVVRNAAVGGLVIGLLLVGLQRIDSPASSRPEPVHEDPTGKVARPRPLARPGHAPAEIGELLAHQGDVIPEDFEKLWKKMQALVVQDKLPSGITDGKAMMRLWILSRREPTMACRELKALIEKLRERSGS